MVPNFAVALTAMAAFWSAAWAVSPSAPVLRSLNARQSGSGEGTTWGIVLKFPFKTYIDSWSLTLTVPSVPSPQVDQGYTVAELATNSIYYVIELASYGNPKKINCNAKPGQWCLAPSYFLGSERTNGTVAVVSPKDVLVWTFTQETPTTGSLGPAYRIKVTRNGQTLTQLRPDNDIGLGVGYVVASACDLNSQKLPQFSYSNLTYGLGLPYPAFITDSPPQQQYGGTNSKPYTTNGGLTWKIDTLSLKSVQCTV